MMVPQQPVTIYPWQRYWMPREAPLIALEADDYLPDPSTTLGRFSHPQLQTIAAFAAVPCLVLLGEPGSGKTHELAQLAAEDRALHEPAGDLVRNIPLAARDRAVPLRDYLVGTGAPSMAWRDG